MQISVAYNLIPKFQPPNHKPQTTNHKPQTTNHKPQTTNHKPQTTDPPKTKAEPEKQISVAYNLILDARKAIDAQPLTIRQQVRA